MSRLVKTSIYAGLIAGTVDIGSACVINFLNPGIILRVIASGVLGRAAFHEGDWVLALGLILQWAMSILIAALFVFAAAKSPGLRRRWVPAGIAYGIVVFIVMTFVVVPLSAAGLKPHFTLEYIGDNTLAMVLFGLIVAYVAKRGLADG